MTILRFQCYIYPSILNRNRVLHEDSGVILSVRTIFAWLPDVLLQKGGTRNFQCNKVDVKLAIFCIRQGPIPFTLARPWNQV